MREIAALYKIHVKNVGTGVRGRDREAEKELGRSE